MLATQWLLHPPQAPRCWSSSPARTALLCCCTLCWQKALKGHEGQNCPRRGKSPAHNPLVEGGGYLACCFSWVNARGLGLLAAMGLCKMARGNWSQHTQLQEGARRHTPETALSRPLTPAPTSSKRVSNSTAALIVNLPMLWSVSSASLLNGLLMLKPGMSSSRVLTPSFANSAAASALGASTTGYLQDTGTPWACSSIPPGLHAVCATCYCIIYAGKGSVRLCSQACVCVVSGVHSTTAVAKAQRP